MTKIEMKKIAKLMVLAALLLLGLKYFDNIAAWLWLAVGVITPFLLGAAIAFVLNVPMRQIEKGLFGSAKAQRSTKLQRAARPVSLTLTLLCVAGLLALLVLVVAPQLGTTLVSIGKSAQAFVPKAEKWLTTIFNDNPQIMAWASTLELDWGKIIETVTKYLQSGATALLSGSFNAAVSVLSGVTNFFIGLIFACYVLMQKEKLGGQLLRILHACMPEKRVQNIQYVCTLSAKTFASFITGQCFEAVILGLLFFVSMSILRLPYPLLVCVLVAFTALIPIFGAIIGCVISAIMILMLNPMQALVFVILFLVLQQVEGNFIYPHVVGNSVGLPSIWVLVAVTVGGSLMGIVGMLIFIPISSVCYTLLREWTNERNAQKKKNPAKE